MNKRVVITGIGMVGPFGAGICPFWTSITEGQGVLRPITRYPFPGLGGEVPDFSLGDFIEDRNLARLPRISQYAVASAVQAVSDAGFEWKKVDQERIAIMFGTSNGPSFVTEKIYSSILTEGKKHIDPLFFRESVFNAPAGIISILLGIKGPCVAMAQGLAGGGYAFTAAFNYIVNHDIDVVLAVGSDELTQAVHEAYSFLGILSKTNTDQEGMRPFDRTRNGMVLAEGAVTIILEREAHAVQRGARIYGEVVGCGMASDGYRVADNDSDGRGLSLSMKNAVTSAGIDDETIDYIAASAMSDKRTDAMEIKAIKRVFGERAHHIPISSIQSSIGHTMGPSSLFNIVAGLLTIKNGIVPPTINYRFFDKECDLDVVPNQARQVSVETVMANSYSWGGLYTSIIVGKFR